MTLIRPPLPMQETSCIAYISEGSWSLADRIMGAEKGDRVKARVFPYLYLVSPFLEWAPAPVTQCRPDFCHSPPKACCGVQVLLLSRMNGNSWQGEAHSSANDQDDGFQKIRISLDRIWFTGSRIPRRQKVRCQIQIQIIESCHKDG